MKKYTIKEERKGRIMKQIKKVLTLLLMVTVLMLVPVLQAGAAAQNPGRVKKLSSKAVSETSVRLTWGRVSKASGYYIYRLNENTGAVQRVGSTKNTNYTVKNLKPYQKYSYQVYAYRKVKGKTYLSTEGSPIRRVQTSIKTPGTPGTPRMDSRGDCTVKLKWSGARNASGYYLYQREGSGKEKRIATVKGTSYTVKDLEDGKKYTYRLQAYRSVKGVTKTGKYSKGINITGKAFTNAGKSVHGRYFNVTVRSNTTATRLDTKKKIKISKGTKMIATTRSSKTLTAIMKNGTKIRIAGNKLRYNSLHTVTKGYSKTVKEAFVNERGYSSSSRYLIWISQYTTEVSIFKGRQGDWRLVRSMPCIVGAHGKTPLGTHRLCRRDSAYGGPRVYFTWNNKKQWGNSFHRRTDGHSRGARSSGCIRLGDSDLNYLVSHCPMGTTVVSY